MEGARGRKEGVEDLKNNGHKSRSPPLKGGRRAT